MPCNYVPRFLFFYFFASFLFLFLLFPSKSIDDMGATSGGFSFGSFFFLACFQMGFDFVTTGWIFAYVCEFNQSIRTTK